MHFRAHRGFSLIELLVVISIISILAAIIFPVFAAAQERGRIATCQSNLRQIGIAFQSYLQDWDSCYPNTDNPLLWTGRFWRWPLQPYLALAEKPVPGDPLHSRGKSPNVLLCPSDAQAEQSYDSTSYAYSMCFYVDPDDINSVHTFGGTVTPPGPPCSTQNEASVSYPSRKVLVTEWLTNHQSLSVGWNDPATAWQGSRGYLFADGHCQYLASRQISPAQDGLPDINLTHNGIEGTDLRN